MSTPETPRRRVPLWVTLLLVVSLGLNLLVAGTVGGVLLRMGGDRDRGGDAPRPIATLRVLGLGPLVFALDREGRADLARATEAREDDLDPGRSALAAATGSLVAALRAEPFDADAAAAALAAQRAAVGDLQGVGHDVLLGYLDDADAATRARIADRIEGHLQRRPAFDR